jgi:asparagine synthase (glutamine-hydrolysing)
MAPQRAENEVRRMLGVMHHESFYVTRTWSDADLGVYLGWTSHAGAFDDADAQVNETRDLTLIFSGEEYPEPGTANRLKQRGHAIGVDPISYLVHQYEERPDFLVTLNGVFHGVVIDRRQRRVTVFNDRYGMHRLYYHEGGEAMYFGAEAKAILAVRPELRRIDLRGLGEAITLGCVLENRSIFDGIHVLPPASAWVFGNGGPVRKTTYFEPREWEEQQELDEEQFYEELRDAFSRNLPRYLNGPQRAGVSLTGGLDSRMVMAWQREEPGSLPCYTWGNTYRDCQDVIVGRAVAEACHQPYHVIPIGQEFLARFSWYAERAVFLTDGLVDIGLAPDVYMNEHARALAPARITGLYGGEVLRGVRAFKHQLPQPQLFSGELVPHFHRAGATFKEISEGNPISFAVFRQAPWHHYSSLSLEQSQVTMRSPFLDNDVVRAVFRAPEAACRKNDASMRLIADGNPALARIPTDHGLGGGRSALVEKLAYNWQRFTFRAEYAYDRGMPQWLAKIDYRIRPLHIEKLFLGLHKPLHFRIWYRDQLAGYLRETLLDPRSLARPYVQRKVVEEMVAGHIKGDRNYTTQIHKLLKLELIHRTFIDGPVSAGTSAKLAAATL